MPTTKTKSAPVNKNASASPGKASSSHESNLQLEKLFHDQLKDIYWAEKHLTKALPKMAKAATSDELKQAIDDHLAQTEEHVSRLEQVFDMLGHKAQAKKCDAMEGLLKEGDSMVEETEEGSMTRDAGIIMASQKVEHYEIATYGTLVTLAKTMGLEDVAEVLHSTLDEEKQADEALTDIAKASINWQAGQEEEGEDEEK